MIAGDLLGENKFWGEITNVNSSLHKTLKTQNQFLKV